MTMITLDDFMKRMTSLHFDHHQTLKRATCPYCPDFMDASDGFEE